MESLLEAEMARVEVIEDIDWDALDHSAMFFKTTGSYDMISSHCADEVAQAQKE